MPRIAKTWDHEPFDYCRSCYAMVKRNVKSEIDFDVDHPPYSETDYSCDSCKAPLTDDDNWE